MNRIKTKRILSTIAVLLVLSFLGSMVLHKQHEPIITGKISQEDVSEVSRIALAFEKGLMRGQLSADLQNRNGSLLIRHLRDYAHVYVHSIETHTNGTVYVIAGEGTNAESTEYHLIKRPNGWSCVDMSTVFRAPSNTAPVSQVGVVR